MTTKSSTAIATIYPSGLVFDVQFSEFSARMTPLPKNKLQLHVDHGVYTRTEVVNMTAVCIRPGIFLVSWTEGSCATVVHLEDFVEQKVYSYSTLPDGTLLRMEGLLSFVNE